MRSAKKEKILNLKIVFGVVLVLFFALSLIIGILKSRDKNENLDYKIGIVASDGMALISISNERKMINVLNLGTEVDVWIPGGIGWKNNRQVKNILEKENQISLLENTFWYNFGFLTDKVLFLDSINDWKKDSNLIKNLGFLNWVKYKINYDKMLIKKEEITGLLSENDLFLSEIMVRDFSESKINNEELRLSVFNNTSESGLASFMSKRLEWSGFSVVSSDNNDEKIDKCLIVYGNKIEENYGWKIVNKIFECDKKYNESLNDNEMELYFGDKLAEMIKYSSYIK